jgi:Pvc16 N-terminal domain
MIHAAISHIASQLNQYLKRTFDLSEDIVVTSNIVEQDGTVVSNINNKLVLCLVNVEKDTTPARQQYGNAGADRSTTSPPPLYINLYLMVIGHFSSNNYSEALKFISNTISFFQRCPVFDHQNTPDLDRRVEKLVLDIENLNIQDLSNVWGILSGKYLPSVLYKVRMVSFDSGDIKSQTPAVKEPQYLLNS